MERIESLFRMASKARHDQKMADRYAGLALRLSMRYNVPIRKELKMLLCKGCSSYIFPGIAAVARASKSQQAVTIACQKCGAVKRYPYRREKIARKQSQSI